jgi:hypothetical protein
VPNKHDNKLPMPPLPPRLQLKPQLSESKKPKPSLRKPKQNLELLMVPCGGWIVNFMRRFVFSLISLLEFSSSYSLFSLFQKAYLPERKGGYRKKEI